MSNETDRTTRGWRRALRWLGEQLPAPPEPGSEPSPKARFIIWQIRNRLPVSQGRPRGGGPDGLR